MDGLGRIQLAQCHMHACTRSTAASKQTLQEGQHYECCCLDSAFGIVGPSTNADSVLSRPVSNLFVSSMIVSLFNY